MRITKVRHPLQPRMNKTAKIEEIRMKIANIEQMIANGFIDPEEGKQIIENLKEQIVQIKNDITEEPIPQENNSQENEETNKTNKKDNYEFGKNDFYSQQALYNKYYLGIN